MCYISVAPWRIWRYNWKMRHSDSFVGIFRNLSYVIPGRWGIHIGGLEIGSRSPGDPVGVWLKDHGLWPW